jgi:hypothetical protein
VGIDRAGGVAASGGGRWSVDHLFLDQEAIPTLVEVKCSSDSRIRREVVGQMLDYAANAVVYWPIETVRSLLNAAVSMTVVTRRSSSRLSLSQTLNLTCIGIRLPRT